MCETDSKAGRCAYVPRLRVFIIKLIREQFRVHQTNPTLMRGTH